MNDSYNEWLLENNYWFPSPTGVNHYEYKTAEVRVYVSNVSVPNRG